MRAVADHPVWLPERFRRSLDRCRRAFTLLELTFVLALTALLATVTAVSLTAPLRSANLQDTMDRITTFDRQARALAANVGTVGSAEGPVTLTFHPGRIERTHAGATSTLPLPARCRIGRVRIAREGAVDGEGVVRFSPASPTYALEILSPRSPPTWLVIAGLTGVSLQTTNAQEIDAIFAR